MLYKATDLAGYALTCRDGEIGSVHEVYFDDEHWTIRYLVVNTGPWLNSQVLISPYALVAMDQKDRSIIVDLMKKQIKASPSAGSDKPVSLQFEEDYHRHYGWPIYWGGAHAWGPSPIVRHDHT